MAMKCPVREIGAPMRVAAGTSGREPISAEARMRRSAGEMVSGEKSETREETSLMVPSLWRTAGFSAPLLPKRKSFKFFLLSGPWPPHAVVLILRRHSGKGRHQAGYSGP